MRAQAGLTRRSFLKVSATAAGGMVLSLNFTGPGAAKANGSSSSIGYYVEINPDNEIIIGAPATDMGQGVNTSLPMLIAEELDIAWDQCRIEQMPLILEQGADQPIRLEVWQGAGGSTSIMQGFEPLRRAGATVRHLLLRAAAEAWAVSLDELSTENAHVSHQASGRKLSYGQLAEVAAGLTMDKEEVPLKDPKNFRIIGQPLRSVHLERIVTGSLPFGIDGEMPGMVTAMIERAPRFDAKVIDFDATEAMKVPGVKAVLKIEGPEPKGLYNLRPIADGVAVLAENTWAAKKGREQLRINWTEGPYAHESDQSLAVQIDELMARPGQTLNNYGDVDAAMARAARVFERRYDLPYVSHATMEPQNCLAHVEGKKCKLIVSTQDAIDCAVHVARVLGLKSWDVEVEFLKVGGGFGRRLDVDYALEAALLSRDYGGPVKVIWTREDDMSHDYYRALAHQRLMAGFDANGNWIAYDLKVASPGRYHRRGRQPEDYYIPEMWLDDYPARTLANNRSAYFFVDSGAPRGPWRAPGHTPNAFAVQSFLDEIAVELGEDPLAFRIRHLEPAREVEYRQHGGPTFDTGRLINVYRKAAQAAGWGRKLPKGRGLGIAGHFTFGSYAAHVIEVELGSNGDLSIHKVWGAVDCGIVVNPEGVRKQMESGIMDGLSTALGQKITIAGGAVVEQNFDQYRMMRIDQAPEVEIHILETDFKPWGMGEPSLPPVAPALCNAIFAAVGKRIRRLPIADQLRSA